MTTPALPECRVVVDGRPHSGAWNMAVDEFLLEAAVHHDRCSMRWYQWERPTVSLGYFQNLATIDAYSELAGLPVVRRLSGGGAIVHDRELTYACALPASHPLAREPRALYTRIHARIIEVLAEFGVPAEFRGERDAGRDGQFLCFGRGDAFDVVMDGQKILGSAQRRRKGAVLQHGALVLSRSPHAPQFPGILDLWPSSTKIEIARLSEQLVAGVAQSISGQYDASPLTPDEVRAINSVVVVMEDRSRD